MRPTPRPMEHCNYYGPSLDQPTQKVFPIPAPRPACPDMSAVGMGSPEL